MKAKIDYAPWRTLMNLSVNPMTIADFGAKLPEKPWIWEGYIAPGQITVFTSLWKSGKSTLLAHLLSHRRAGGKLANKTVTAGTTLIVSEETPAQWQARHDLLGFGPRDQFLLRPCMGFPSMEELEVFIVHLRNIVKEGKHDLVVIDPLARFLPTWAESNSQTFLDTLAPFTDLMELGAAVLLIHHPAKKRMAEGMASRGSGTLPAFADYIIEMHFLADASRDDRRRRLVAFSRDAATPRSQIIELSADGLHYACLEEPPLPDDLIANWSILRQVFASANGQLTHPEIRANWPPEYSPPRKTTLWRWLKQAETAGLLLREGDGVRSDPYRFMLPDRLDVSDSAPPPGEPELAVAGSVLRPGEVAIA